MHTAIDWDTLALQIKDWGRELGFQQVGIADIDLRAEAPRLHAWLEKQYHGEMEWMAHHADLRTHPDALLPGTVRAICVRMNYLPPQAAFARTLRDPAKGYISRYALGRDYHKVMRQRLKKLGEKIKQHCATLNFRPFVDSAPVLERPLAHKAGLGWTGKHTLLLNRDDGSWFFLGELLVNLPLPVDTPQVDHCGRCSACLSICPTGAIVEPYVVDARRCISYLTIELQGSIPEALRPLIGNRIYGCDDCQIICPWNRYASLTDERDFQPRAPLHTPELLELFRWREADFLRHTEGSPIRRIGFVRWSRNIAVALGNAPADPAVQQALRSRLGEDPLLDEHIHCALEQQCQKQAGLIAFSLPPRLLRLIRSTERGLPRDA